MGLVVIATIAIALIPFVVTRYYVTKERRRGRIQTSTASKDEGGALLASSATTLAVKTAVSPPLYFMSVSHQRSKWVILSRGIRRSFLAPSAVYPMLIIPMGLTPSRLSPLMEQVTPLSLPPG